MKRFFHPLLAAALLTGCASPNFLAVSPHPVVTGTGGTPTNYLGVQFWQNGATPNRKYEVLGYADDYWRGPAFDEADFRTLSPLVTKNGGDAGVEIRGDKPAPGLQRRADEVGDSVLRLQVIKYVP